MQALHEGFTIIRLVFGVEFKSANTLGMKPTREITKTLGLGSAFKMVGGEVKVVIDGLPLKEPK